MLNAHAWPRAVLAAFSAVGVVSCGDGGYSGGLSSPPGGKDLYSTGEGTLSYGRAYQAVRAQSAIDFGCAPERVELKLVHQDESVFAATGCGRAATYVDVALAGATSHAPGGEGIDYYVTLHRFVPVSSPDTDRSVAWLDAQAARLALLQGSRDFQSTRIAGMGVLTEWVDLSKAAARDLECPREGILLDVVRHSRAPNTYLAEGCGTRGTFVKNSREELVLVSRVPLTKPAPTH